MATLPTYVKTSEVRSYPARRREDKEKSRTCEGLRVEADPFVLRPLPGEDIFFFSKRIDNARVARQADPRARGAAWSTACVMCLLAGLGAASLTPRIGNWLAGYKLEALRQEQQRLIEERMGLDVDEAVLLSPANLDELAQRHNLVKPKAGQIFDLDAKGDASLASLAPKAR